MTLHASSPRLLCTSKGVPKGNAYEPFAQGLPFFLCMCFLDKQAVQKHSSS